MSEMHAASQPAVGPQEVTEWSWERRPPGWAFNLWFVAIAVAALSAAVTPEGYFVLLLGAGAAFFGLGIVWLVRAVMYAAARPLFRQPRAMLAFALPPLLSLGGFVAAQQDLPLRAGFELSRSEFAEAAESLSVEGAPSVRAVDAEGKPLHPRSLEFERRLGIYEIDRAEVYAEGVVLYRETFAQDPIRSVLCFFCSLSGFAYFPDESEPTWILNSSGELVDLGDGWYAFHWGWD
jgi:hypothetical protein